MWRCKAVRANLGRKMPGICETRKAAERKRAVVLFEESDGGIDFARQGIQGVRGARGGGGGMLEDHSQTIGARGKGTGLIAGSCRRERMACSSCLLA